jgi:hypothetical protein
MLDDAQLIKYIDYFSDDKIEFYKWTTLEQQEDGVIEMGYPRYDEGVSRFIDDLYKSDLIDGGYLESLERYGTKASTPAELIVTADIDLLKAVLTYYVRQERFCDGAWVEAIEEKVFLKILLRLKELRRL